MLPCQACGHVNDDAARFCSNCGTALTPVTATATREERKVVTVLFADLVGFTSRAERLDPEDVRALLAPYYARLRTELERFGGTVEKFIGDAVMALFGGPVTHEDDPERAVRAALAIRDWVLEQSEELQLRIAVNTGEALVVLGARPGHGEGMASGDVVNTASRLQSAAPVNGILVGEVTYRATSDVIDYAATEAVQAKGKPRPIPVWRALQARSRPGGDRPVGERTALVGRDHELATLVEALARARRDRSSQLITVTGVPGMGKTRLIAELREVVDADPALIRWRQGRSLPYGDGISLWALSEMVKSEAGILDGDQGAEVETKLAAAVGAAVEATDAGWVLTHLRPLVGLGRSEDLTADRRTEAFAAWRRFFEGLSEEAPLVLAFDDLQWADDVLLDFIDHLTEWAAGAPLLVVCASRPELFERRREWGGGKRNATTISLAPLSPADTAQLIGGLGAGSHIPAALRDTLVAKAGGNPLYAEQYLRMLAERRSADELPLPETVQGIVAARLDRLPVEEKQLLQGAAVVGSVFWPGALLVPESLDRARLEHLLHTLERKDFVRRARRSSMADQPEYSFLQDLVRDVAYGQIPRAPRGAMHRHVADWFASVSDGADRAEVLAHHYLSAVQLAQAVGQSPDDDLLAQAVASLGQAGDHALALGAHSRAVSYYASGAGLAAPATAEHGRLLFRLGRARFIGGDEDPSVLATASSELLSCADQETAAEAEATLAELEWVRGDQASAVAHLEEARVLVQDRPLSRAKAAVMSTVARHLMTADDNAGAIRVGREALAMAEELGMDAVRSSALNSIGVAKSHSGDPTGKADLERSAVIASEANLPNELCHARGNMARLLWEQGRLEDAALLYEDAGAAAHRFGLDAYVRWVRGDRAADRYVLGRWEDALAAANPFIAEVEAGSPHYSATSAYAARASIRLGRGDDKGARRDAESSLEVARQSGDRQNLFPWLATTADIFYELGDVDRAAALAGEFLAGVPGSGRSALDYHHMLAWTLRRVGRAQELLDALPNVDSPWTRAAVAFASGDLADAAAICQEMGAVSQEARVRLWLAADLVAGHRDADARIELERALDFYRRVRGTRYLAVGEALLGGDAASVQELAQTET